MGRKNRRAKVEYRDRLGFNPSTYIQSGGSGRVNQVNGASAHTDVQPRRGDIWFAELGSHYGTSVQGGCRPVMVISNDKGNHHADTFNVLPMTSKMKKFNLPSHTVIEENNMTERDMNREFETSMILAEQITTIGRSAFRSYLGRVTDEQKLSAIETAVRIQLGL